VTPCIWLGTTHPCNPPNYGLWVNLLFFMMCICKHCFPPMLLVFAMKYCTKMPCPLPHNHYCCLLSSPVCLPHLLICTCLISSPIACPPSSVLCWCLLRFFYFLMLTLIVGWVCCLWRLPNHLTLVYFYCIKIYILTTLIFALYYHYYYVKICAVYKSWCELIIM